MRDIIIRGIQLLEEDDRVILQILFVVGSNLFVVQTEWSLRS